MRQNCSRLEAEIKRAAEASQRRIKQRIAGFGTRIPTQAELERIAEDEMRRIESDLS